MFDEITKLSLMITEIGIHNDIEVEILNNTTVAKIDIVDKNTNCRFFICQRSTDTGLTIVYSGIRERLKGDGFSAERAFNLFHPEAVLLSL